MKKLEIKKMEIINGGVKSKNCATAGIFATASLFAGPGGIIAGLAIFGGMALSDCDLF